MLQRDWHQRLRRGLTLIELVIVIMLLSILAGVAAPKFTCVSEQATDNGLCQTLEAIRKAIELYAAENNKLPGQDIDASTMWGELSSYLRCSDVVCPVGPAQNSKIKFNSSSSALTGEPNPTKGWRYSTKTGEFIVNYTGLSCDDVTQYDEF